MSLSDLYVQELINSLNTFSENLNLLKDEIINISNDSGPLMSFEGKYYSLYQYNQLLKGVEEGLDVSIYADPGYDELKMAAIRHSLLEGLAISKNDINPDYSFSQLYQVLRAIKYNYPISILNKDISPEKMIIYIEACKKNIDITPYFNNFEVEELKVIMSCIENNMDVNKLAVRGMTAEQMNIVFDGLKNNLDVSKYNHPGLSSSEMHDIFLDLMNSERTEYNYISLSIEFDNVKNAKPIKTTKIEEALEIYQEYGGKITIYLGERKTDNSNDASIKYGYPLINEDGSYDKNTIEMLEKGETQFNQDIYHILNTIKREFNKESNQRITNGRNTV